MDLPDRMLLSGDEAVALGAFDAGVRLGTGYPGTPSTEILERLNDLGGRAQWAANEKVALEVAIGAAYGGARALATMKHVGLNVAADPFFTSAYTGVSGGLVVVSADDPGMSSSQNEQDNRRYAAAAGTPMVEPADSQEAYDFTRAAFDISERWGLPVLLRMTTRVCHSKSIVQRGKPLPPAAPKPYRRDLPGRVMIPAHARPAHRKLRAKLSEIAAWSEATGLNQSFSGAKTLGIIASGVAYMHAREAALNAQSQNAERGTQNANPQSPPTPSFFKLGLTYPLPLESLRDFAKSVERCVVIEEGDPYLAESLRAAGIAVEDKPAMFRFGELNTARVRRIIARDASPEPAPPRGKPPALCKACPYHIVYHALRDLNCIASGDIGCYTLGVLPPYEALDTCLCMGAAIGVGLGLRHALPEEEARRVVSVIGDSTFVHSGITGIVEMAYNPPASGHVVLILDNSTTAMTGHQEHPGTGRQLDHKPTGKLILEDLIRAVGIPNVDVIDPIDAGLEAFRALLKSRLDSGELCVIIARRTCILAAGKIRQYEREAAQCGVSDEK